MAHGPVSTLTCHINRQCAVSPCGLSGCGYTTDSSHGLVSRWGCQCPNFFGCYAIAYNSDHRDLLHDSDRIDDYLGPFRLEFLYSGYDLVDLMGL
nr:hypothetical protein Iba_chr09fCG12340 [Ipomoea batatas]